MNLFSINKMQLLGNLGKDPEVRYTPNGLAVAKFSLATTESVKNATTGQYEDETEWHNIVVFGKHAEIVQKELSKGSSLYLEGKKKTSKWIDKNGEKRSTVEIVVDFDGTIKLVGSRGRGSQTATPSAVPASHNIPPQAPNNAIPNPELSSFNDEDINSI